MSSERDKELTLRSRASTSSADHERSYTPPLSRREISGRSSDSDQSLNRFADVMAGLLKEIAAPRQPSMVRGDAVPPFDPEDDNQSIEDWCAKVDEMRQMFRWSEDVTIFNALSKLQGLGSVWYKGLKSVKFTWDEWKIRLCRAFPSQRDFHDRLQDMIKRRKRVDETFSRYFYEKQALLNACRITGRDAVSCIIGGISENHIKSAARAGNFQDPEALFDYLRCLSHETPTQTRHFSSRSATFNRKRKHDECRKPGVCFLCNKSGHLRKDCPTATATTSAIILKDTRTCYTCQEKGHIAPKCPKRPKTSHHTVA